MTIKVGDMLMAEEDGCFWPLGDSPRTPQRLAVEAPVVWVTSKALRVKLPRISVTLNGRTLVLPATRRELNRFEDRLSWRSQTIEPMEPLEWPNKPFYPTVEGRWATARTATYYTPEAWHAYSSVLQGEDPHPQDRGIDSILAPPRSLRAHAKLLGVEPTAGRTQVIDAFREKVKSAHPDGGGDPAAFRLLIEARDAMLARGDN
jgi:hypothetical protein